MNGLDLWPLGVLGGLALLVQHLLRVFAKPTTRWPREKA